MKKPYMIPAKYVVNEISFSRLADAEFYAVEQMVLEYLDNNPEIIEKGAHYAAQVAVNQIFDHCQVSIRNNPLTKDDNA